MAVSCDCAPVTANGRASVDAHTRPNANCRLIITMLLSPPRTPSLSFIIAVPREWSNCPAICTGFPGHSTDNDNTCSVPAGFTAPVFANRGDNEIMRKFGLLLAGGAFALIASGLALADEANVRKEITATFDKSVDHFKNKDIKGFMSMFAPGYTSKSVEGRTQTLADTETEMKQAMDATKSVDGASIKIERLRMVGYGAEVVSTMKLTMHVVDKDGGMGGKPGRIHVMGIEERSKETWIKDSSGQWKLKNSVSLAGAKTTLDGKLLPSMASGAPPSGKPTSKVAAKPRS